MTLSALFSRCVNRSYLTAPHSVNYAADLVHRHLILYFQDSEGLVDWRNNLDFLPAPCRREGRTAFFAHRGFLRLYTSLIPRLEPLIRDAEVEAVTVVGYSHGAALALLCFEDAYRHRPELRERLTGYGFGCPRVLWGALRPEVAARWDGFTVVRNRDDAVTHLPPAILGYRHAGRLLEIGESGKYSSVDAHRPENLLRELKLYEKNPKHREGKSDRIQKNPSKSLDKPSELCYNTPNEPLNNR